MQKLLRRTPSPSGPLILSVNTPFCLSFCNTTSAVSPLGFRNSRDIPKMSSSIAALRFFQQPIVPVSTTAAASSFRLKRNQPSSCLPCSCSLEKDTNTAPLRAWVVRKNIQDFGSVGVLAGRQDRAWFTTVAGAGSAKGGDELENEVDGEISKVRLQRRNRSSGGGGVVVSCPDLRTIPGVGPRNLRKLVDKGFEGVAQLKKLYKDKFYGDSSQKMVEYLQSSVGIIHKNHAESITTYIKESVDEEQKENSLKQAQKKRITLCVEGNISVGKTTFLQKIANETFELRDLVEIVPEPIDKWQNVGRDHFNILDAFYAEPERYAYTFQNYVFVTRVMQERESSAGIKPLRLMERSVFSDRMVFVRAVHEAKWMNEMEISIYDSWFDPVVSSLPGLIPDGFIYLRASPDTCHKRMMLRKREEEGGVSLDYLRGLHEKHESWLLPFESGNHGVLSVSKMANEADWSLHPNIKDRVFYLDGDHMHSSIQKVPALVLDCEPDIDFRRDIEAKRAYARQVAEFFEFVKKKKGIPASNVGSQPQVLVPHNQNLWMPFPSSALNESFKQAFSPMPQ